MTYVLTFTRTEEDIRGAKLLHIVQKRPAVSSTLKLWDTKYKYSDPKSANIDQKLCKYFQMDTLQISMQQAVQSGLYNSTFDREYQLVGGLISGAFISSSPYFRRLIDEQKFGALKAAQLIFDNINIERLKQQYARECTALVVEHRAVATNMTSFFPKV
jgi:hypothetical protein